MPSRPRILLHVIHYGQFVLLGLLTAAVGEWQFSVFLRNDPNNFLGSLVFNGVYLIGVCALTALVLPTLRRWPPALYGYTLFFGVCGLMVEWFLIGNSPWGNPQASQIGMFAYWACMALVPLTFWLPHTAKQRFIRRYALGYFIITALGQAFIPAAEWRFAFHIYTVILGYLGLMTALLWNVWAAP